MGNWGAESGLPYPVATHLADIAREQGDDLRARELYEQALAPARARGDGHAAAYPLRGLADLFRAGGDFDEAAALFKESLALVWELKDQRCACFSIEGLARVTGAQGTSERAARLFGATEAVRERVGPRLLASESAGYEHDLATVRTALGEAAFATAWDEGSAMSLEQAIAYALGP